jgi:F-type H+-transporting ATPase subunit b
MDFTRIGLIFSGHGFGFNTNILETNVINLAVVIAVVVSVVGDAVRELLKNRKETIINNLREADNRANEALERDLAKAQLQEAQPKEIEQGFLLLNKKNAMY